MSGIVVGIDGSEHSERALEWAVREAGLRKSPLTVLTVVQQIAGYWGVPVMYPGDGDFVATARKNAQDAVDKAVAQLGESAPASVAVRSVAGLPAEALVSASEGADLLVVGSRGTGGFARLLLGSVSSSVVHHAHCPVVVVPATDRS